MLSPQKNPAKYVPTQIFPEINTLQDQILGILELPTNVWSSSHIAFKALRQTIIKDLKNLDYTKKCSDELICSLMIPKSTLFEYFKQEIAQQDKYRFLIECVLQGIPEKQYDPMLERLFEEEFLDYTLETYPDTPCTTSFTYIDLRSNRWLLPELQDVIKDRYGIDLRWADFSQWSPQELSEMFQQLSHTQGLDLAMVSFQDLSHEQLTAIFWNLPDVLYAETVEDPLSSTHICTQYQALRKLKMLNIEVVFHSHNELEQLQAIFSPLTRLSTLQLSLKGAVTSEVLTMIFQDKKYLRRLWFDYYNEGHSLSRETIDTFHQLTAWIKVFDFGGGDFTCMPWEDFEYLLQGLIHAQKVSIPKDILTPEQYAIYENTFPHFKNSL